MMHGRGSRVPLLAAKPANKADPPTAEQSVVETAAAEPVERGWGPRGMRTTKHAPGAEPGDVSQALERIRKVARERKKEKFTALLHHISIDLLGEAFFELKKTPHRGSMD